MMTTLRDILLAELSAVGLNVKKSPSARALRRVTEQVCTLSLAGVEIADAAFGRYLGTITDPEEGEIPLFGRAFTAEAELAAFAPGPDGCDACAGAALDALLNLPGLSIPSFSMEEMGYDDDTAAFRRVVRAKLQGILYCEQAGEEAVFTDFRLIPTVRRKENIQ